MRGRKLKSMNLIIFKNTFNLKFNFVVIILLLKLHVWVLRVKRSHVPVAAELFTCAEVRARPIKENLN